MNLCDKIKYSNLLDIYQKMFTDHQVNILKQYLYEDFTMQEIANNLNVSKSAISDIIKRTINELNDIEKKLKVCEKSQKIVKLLKKSLKLNQENNLLIDKIEKIIGGI